MTEKEKKYLSDILRSIVLIESFIDGVTSFNVYSKDDKTKSAVERQLVIIGEAINKYIKEEPDNVIENATQIISLRNRLVHAYDNIDDTIVWSVLTLHLAILKNEVENLLSD